MRPTLLFAVGGLAACAWIPRPSETDGNLTPCATPPCDTGPTRDTVEDTTAPTGDTGDVKEGPNTVPVVSGVGLNSYRPVVDETLSAQVGPSFDPDGDVVSVTYVWRRNGTPISGETRSSLPLPVSVYDPGDEILLELTFSDGRDEVIRTAGPAIVQADDTSRWRMLAPPRAGDGSIGWFDAKRQRLLFAPATDEATFGLWEMQLSGASPRWVRLDNAIGSTLGGFRTPLPDPENDRVLTFGGDAAGGFRTNDLYALEYGENQGSERWVELTPAGTPPSPRIGEGAVEIVLPGGDRAFLLMGGQGDDDGPLVDDAFLLRVDGGGETWEELKVPLPPAALAPVLFFDGTRRRVFAAGGFTGTEASDRIYMWDLDQAYAKGFVELGARLPSPLVLASAVVEGDVAYLFGGAEEVQLDSSDPPTLHDRLVTLDLTSLAVSSKDLADRPSVPITVVPVSRAPFDDGYVVFARGFQFAPVEYFTFDPSAAAWTPLVSADTSPPPLYQGLAMNDPRGLILTGGRTLFDDPVGNSGVYAFKGAYEALSFSGPTPGVRWGATMDTIWFGEPRLYWFGGATEPGETVSSSVWRLDPGRTTWTEITVAKGQSVPELRSGHTLFHGSCDYPNPPRGNVMGMFGGRLASSGDLTNELLMSECNLSDRDNPVGCTWFSTLEKSANPALPTAWSASAMVQGDEGGVEFALISGGLTDQGATNALYVYDTCNGPAASGGTLPQATWRTAEEPPAAYGHTLTAIPSDVSVAPRAIWLFGGTVDDGGTVTNTVGELTWNGELTSPAATFTPLDIAGDAPLPRMFHQVTYDPDQERILLYGGLRDQEVLDDLWELRLRD